MKKFIFIISLALLTPAAYSQNVNEDLDRLIRMISELLSDTIPQDVTGEFDAHIDGRKKRGYFNSTQIGLLMGNREVIERPYYYPYYSYHSIYLPHYYNTRTTTEMQISPSLTMTNGYMFNEHWAAGVGVGFEIFDRNFFPVFADVRYTLWDGKISPYFAVKTGYTFGNFKEKHYDNLHFNFEPYYAYNADFRNYGGFMLHPEMGVKIPLSENADLLFTVAYRHQKIKSKVTQKYDHVHYDEWEHKADLNRLSFGIAIMFR